ncbi:hypothetical protein M413DRAFT_26581 [Hebeloma cylindrosporum]|uniref:Uncharacterized protein n=1 Tax=Hebeloma cylindrosporum TaxID=76867 RepID=A0A0C2YND7_HEBCY|nr:hypothetical protein M413DRAFT_26581 [Hebeloma cylindrosporum h7]
MPITNIIYSSGQQVPNLKRGRLISHGNDPAELPQADGLPPFPESGPIVEFQNLPPFPDNKALPRFPDSDMDTFPESGPTVPSAVLPTFPPFSDAIDFPPFPEMGPTGPSPDLPTFAPFPDPVGLPASPEMGTGSAPDFPQFPESGLTGQSPHAPKHLPPFLELGPIGPPPDMNMLPPFPDLPNFPQFLESDPTRQSSHAPKDLPPFPELGPIGPPPDMNMLPPFPDLEDLLAFLESNTAAFPAFPRSPNPTRFSDLNRGDSPQPLKNTHTRPTSPGDDHPHKKNKTSAPSGPMSDPKATQQRSPTPEDLSRGLKHRRLGDLRLVHPKYFIPTIEELNVAHNKIRPPNGEHHIPYHIGYELALSEAKRTLEYQEGLEDEVIEVRERMDRARCNIERWMEHWGL